MMIEVIKKGYAEAMVEDFLLGNLIESNQIIAFRRASGWVLVGKDSVRVRHRLHTGPERRKVTIGENFSMI